MLAPAIALTRTRFCLRPPSPAPGDTITLEKGVYTLDKQLKIDKDLTVQAAANCGWGDVVITAAAPTDQGHFGGRKDPTCLGIMFNIQGYIPEVCLCVCTHTRTHDRAHTHTLTYMHTCVCNVCVCVCVCARARARVDVCRTHHRRLCLKLPSVVSRWFTPAAQRCVYMPVYVHVVACA